MNRLYDLMDKYCPDGVKFLTLADLFDTRNGYTPSKANKEYWENGTIPWFRMEDIRENGGVLSDSLQHVSKCAVKGELFPANSIIVATSATIGKHALITVDSIANQRFTYLMIKEKHKNKFDIKFLYYYCFKLDEYCHSCLNQGNFASVDMSKFSKFEFPLVPLPVQEEIVRILDNYTELTQKLIAELTTELEIRRKQYKHHKKSLLKLDDPSIPWMTIDSLCNISRGRVISKDYIRDNPGDYPVYSSQTENDGVLGRIAEYTNEGEHLTWTTDGANAGTIFYRNGRFNITNVCGLLKHKEENINIRYLYYILGITADKYVSRGMGNPKLMSNVMAKIKVPIPSLLEQERIVTILDRFDAVCSDLSTSISVEIEARRKQYEYYREKVLSFKELSV